MRYCLRPGCSAKVLHGYCRAHRQQLERGRGSSNARGYTWQWGKRAKRFLDHYPLCGMRPDNLAPVMSACYRDGIRTPATVVDHVVPHRQDPVLFNDEAGNWQALCASCHSRKTRTENQGGA
jgi:5-methylcytosine-specific restriction enzyme A